MFHVKHFGTIMGYEYPRSHTTCSIERRGIARKIGLLGGFWKMPFWLSWSSVIFKDSDGHWIWPWIGAVILAGGAAIAAVAQGTWAVVKFFAERKKPDEKNGGGTKVIQSGHGNASGRDTNIGGDIIYGADGRQIGEVVAEAQRPLLDRNEKLSAEVAELKLRLEQARVGPQVPGSQQAVAEAVDATARDAAAGVPRAKQALALLNAGRIAEAVPLFEAEAAEKKATSRSSAKEAAAAYRNLGAIAGLADPKRALEAYEEAVALDPDDIQSLYWSGAIQIDYGDLAKAQMRLERVQELARSGEQTFYNYAALGGLGDIKAKRGDLAGALQAYQGTVLVVSQLAKADPGNTGWQRDLSVSYNKIGEVQVAQGDLAGALKSFQDSHAIFVKLAKADPGHTGWQRDLSVSNERLGDIFLAQGNLPAALEQYRASVERMVPIRDRDPSNADLQRFTSVTLNKVGDVQVAQGDLAGALKSFQDGLAIFDKLAKADPGHTGWQRDLSVSYNKIGDVQVAQGDLAGALKSFQDSLAIRDKLAKADPGHTGWQRDLSVSYNKIGDVQVAQGDLAGALKSFQDSLAIRDKLAKADPGNAGWQRDLSVSNQRLGDIFLAQDNLPAALEQYRASLERMVPIRDHDLSNADLQRFTSVTFAKLALVHRQSGDNAKALDAFRQGQAIMVRLTKLSPDNAQWKQDLARFDREIAELAER